MSHVNQVLDKLSQDRTEQQQQSNLRSEVTPMRRELLKAGFKKLINYGLMAPDEQVVNDWGNALQDVSDVQLAQGFKAAERFSKNEYFKLSAFRDLCLVDSRFPDCHQAYIEACSKLSPKIKQSWSHNVVYWSGVECVWFDLHSYTEKQIYPKFKRIYQTMCRRFTAGDPMELIEREKIEHLEPIPLTKSENRKLFDELRARNGM